MKITDKYLNEAGLSARAANALCRAGIRTVGEMMNLTEADLYAVPRLGRTSITEVLSKISLFQNAMLNTDAEFSGEPETMSTADLPLTRVGLSPRSIHWLGESGIDTMGQLLRMTEADCYAIRNLGKKSVTEIHDKIAEYRAKGDEIPVPAWKLALEAETCEPADLSDAGVQRSILALYDDNCFGGFSLGEMEQLLPEMPEALLKKNIGSLLGAGKLEYTDFRCYRIYPKFEDCLDCCIHLRDAARGVMKLRLEGKTLEEAGSAYGITRERARQIVRDNIGKVRAELMETSGVSLFDEDYYRCLYENYAFDKREISRWLNISENVWHYMELNGIKQGSGNIEDAPEDVEHLEPAMRLKIRNYLNSCRIFLDGRWVARRRAELEDYVLLHLCHDVITMDEFCDIYNRFLTEIGVEPDEDLFIDAANRRYQAKRIKESRLTLCNQGDSFRVYDIDARDYTELLDTLNLDSYENIELSTLKFMEAYPDVMGQYGIRDQYELHNLLRKILPDDSYHGLVITRMPHLHFGSFDRTAAIRQLMLDNAPISRDELVDLIHREFGYDRNTIVISYLNDLGNYFYNGIYTVDQEPMPADCYMRLQAALTDEFYLMGEVRRIYVQLNPGANPAQVTPYVLHTMGFQIFSNYVMRGYSSLDAYFRSLLTRSNYTDLAPIRSRMGNIQMFNQVLHDLRMSREIIELEPNRLISFHCLERAGVTREMLNEFCDEVFMFADPGKYFSISSLKHDGLETDLFGLGFPDWFYGSVLSTDTRFENELVFGNRIFCLGHAVNRRFFLEGLVKESGSIDVYDLLDQMRDFYKCPLATFSKLVEQLASTDMFYDRLTGRIYASESMFYDESMSFNELN